VRTKRVRRSHSLTHSLFLLSRQVSNLNSSDPESDVLPITPRDSFAVANINKFEKNKNFVKGLAGLAVLQVMQVFWR
jgi:hypothetical protein